MSKQTVFDFLKSIKNPEHQQYLMGYVDWLDYAEPDLMKKSTVSITKNNLYSSHVQSKVSYMLYKEAVKHNPNILPEELQKEYLSRICSADMFKDMSFKEKQRLVIYQIVNSNLQLTRSLSLDEAFLWWDSIQDIEWDKVKIHINPTFYAIFGKGACYDVLAKHPSAITTDYFLVPSSFHANDYAEFTNIIRKTFLYVYTPDQQTTFMTSYLCHGTIEYFMREFVPYDLSLLRFLIGEIRYNPKSAQYILSAKKDNGTYLYSDNIRKFVLATRSILAGKYLKHYKELSKDVYGLLRISDNNLQLVFNSLFPDVEDKECLLKYLP